GPYSSPWQRPWRNVQVSVSPAPIWSCFNSKSCSVRYSLSTAQCPGPLPGCDSDRTAHILKAISSLHPQQQILPLPRTDNAEMGQFFRTLHGDIGFDEALSEQRLQCLTVVQRIQRAAQI